jgi:hypothetical protein
LSGFGTQSDVKQKLGEALTLVKSVKREAIGSLVRWQFMRGSVLFIKHIFLKTDPRISEI